MDERILWKGKRSRRAFLVYYLLATLFFALTIFLYFNLIDIPYGIPSEVYITLIGFGLISILAVEVKRIFVRYVITNERVIKNIGVLSKTEDSIPYEMIEKMICKLSFIQRILNVGDLVVDTGEKQLFLVSIDNPKKIEDLIYKLRDEAWKERYMERGYKRTDRQSS